MNDFNSASRYDIENKINNKDVFASRIIVFAINIGVLLFLFVAWLLNSGRPYQEDVPVSELIDALIYIFIVLAGILYGFNFLFLNKLFLRSARTDSVNLDSIQKLMELERSLMIVRLGMLEAVSIFGVVVLIVAIKNSAVQIAPVLWFLSVPIFIQLVYTLKNFPSKERITDKIVNEILPFLKTR